MVKLSQQLGHLEEGEVNTLNLTAEDILNSWDAFNAINHYAKSWASFTIIVDDVELRTYMERQKFFYAIQEAKDCYAGMLMFPSGQYEYCRGDWSCGRLKTIGVNYFTSRIMWYQVGTFSSATIFRVDKERIKKIVLDDIRRQRLQACPAFDTAQILERINGLPDEIDTTVDPNWKVHSQYELRDGQYVNCPVKLEYLRMPGLGSDHGSVDDLLRKILNNNADRG